MFVNNEDADEDDDIEGGSNDDSNDSGGDKWLTVLCPPQSAFGL